MNSMNKTLCALLAVVLISLLGCNAVENLSNSGSRLILESFKGFILEDGVEGTDEADFIQSDVLVQTTPEQVLSGTGSFFNTNAVVHLNGQLLNPGVSGDDMSYYSNIIIDRIDVSFSRTDGRSQPLVDVPLAFSVPVTQQLILGTSVPITFTLIRHTAKNEPPLRDLREFGQEQVLILVATVKVYGRDLAGNRVEPVTGWIEVHCANFANKVVEETT